MKLEKFYKHAIEFINMHKGLLIQHGESLRNDSNVKDFNLRFAFDCFYAHKKYITITAYKADNFDFDFMEYIASICDLTRDEIIDKHIETLYKKAMIETGLITK